MRLFYGTPEDIESWMRLVERIRGDFPGLETSEGLCEHKATVLRFMSKRQAICVKSDGEIIGVMLFSKGHNMICCLGVSPGYRRRGAASLLMDEALASLDRTREITVSTFREGDEKAPAPRAFYKKYGFVEGALTMEMDYPNQEFVLYPITVTRSETDADTLDIRGKNAFETFSKTRVGCRGIVADNSRILISHELNVDFYSIPGGGMEKNETPEECCAREVLEETGYVIKPVRRFLTLNEYYEEYRYIDYYFVCEVTAKAEQSLTEIECERGLVPEWIETDKILDIFSRHNDYAPTNEEKRGAYLREYTALKDHLRKFRQQ